MPEPVTPDEMSAYAEDKHSRVVEAQEPITYAITLYEAMARALKYNLDHKVEQMEILLRQRQLTVAHYSMLPSIVTNSGYVDRNNFSGGSSVELIGSRATGAESLRSSTSSDRDVRTSDLRFSWNVLDFGLSYVRAHQSADKVLIAEETRRRVVNRVIENVRTAYWKSVTATRLMYSLRALENRVNQALRNTRALAARAESSPLTALTYERELIEIKREIQKLYSTLSVSKTQLAALMNVKPGTPFRVAMPYYQRPPKTVRTPARKLVAEALRSRSELREVVYKERINEKEAEAAILEMLPGISLEVGPNFSSNSFLFNNHWIGWAAKASWNLIKVFSYPARSAEIEARGELLDKRALAVTMAIMTQVHVSRVRLIHARRRYWTAAQFLRVQKKIVNQIRQSLAAGKVSEQTAIREEMNALVARVKFDLAFVELQNAYANLHASVGRDPYTDLGFDDTSVRELAQSLRDGWFAMGDRQAGAM